MKSTFKLINLTRRGKVLGVRLQGRLKQTSKGRAKKRFEKEKVYDRKGSRKLIFIPNRKVGIPDYFSVSREGKALDLLIYARHRRSLRLRFKPTRIP